MTNDEFWQIIENTKAPTEAEQLDLFNRELEQLSIPELLEFARYFYHYHRSAYNWDIWTVAWLYQGGWCSDDGFTDFCYWLISRGRQAYEMAFTNPDDLLEELKLAEEPSFESFGYIPGRCYSERTGVDELSSLTDDITYPRQPTGGEWIRPELKDRSHSNMLNLCVVFNEMGDEEFEAIQQRFPRVWNYCIENGIIKLRAPNAPPDEKADLVSSIEGFIRARVDPNLQKTDLMAYLKAVGEAMKEWNRLHQKQ